MKRQIDVIEALRRANPVPPRMVDIAVVESLEDILGSLSEEETGMSSTTEERKAPAPKTKQRWPKYLGVAAALAVVIAVMIPLTRPSDSGVAWSDVTAEQQAAVEQVLEAINDGDQVGFVDAFVAGGTFNTHMDFESRSSCCDTYPIANAGYVETWMGVNEVWGLAADLEACESDSAETVRCDVVARWDTLHMEQPEEWLFVFDGADLRSFGMLLSRRGLEERTMPLTYDDLGDFEAWLEETHPDRAARWEGETAIDGSPYTSVYLRFNPAFADEISSSLEEFVESR